MSLRAVIGTPERLWADAKQALEKRLSFPPPEAAISAIAAYLSRRGYAYVDLRDPETIVLLSGSERTLAYTFAHEVLHLAVLALEGREATMAIDSPFAKRLLRRYLV